MWNGEWTCISLLARRRRCQPTRVRNETLCFVNSQCKEVTEAAIDRGAMHTLGFVCVCVCLCCLLLNRYLICGETASDFCALKLQFSHGLQLCPFVANATFSRSSGTSTALRRRVIGEMSRRPEEDEDDEDQGGGSAEELAIVKEEVNELVYRIMETHLKDQPWNEASVPDWISQISSDVIKGLTDQQRPYKFTGV